MQTVRDLLLIECCFRGKVHGVGLRAKPLRTIYNPPDHHTGVRQSRRGLNFSSLKRRAPVSHHCGKCIPAFKRVSEQLLHNGHEHQPVCCQPIFIIVISVVEKQCSVEVASFDFFKHLRILKVIDCRCGFQTDTSPLHCVCSVLQYPSLLQRFPDRRVSHASRQSHVFKYLLNTLAILVQEMVHRSHAENLNSVRSSGVPLPQYPMVHCDSLPHVQINDQCCSQHYSIMSSFSNVHPKRQFSELLFR
mmetsp:Transcript_45549/g.120328  ORF Transcript_45549/g.120328 Transcript_45549/m.120328 type:complete len:247 (+) Transcript_45549:656-1396(+)